MKEHSDYIIVQGHKASFIKQVNEKLELGYQLIGGVQVLPPEPDLVPHEDYYYQAMAMRNAP